MGDAKKHGIARNVINPPIEIVKTTFDLDIAKYKYKYYSFVEFFSPLNITLPSIAPISNLFNKQSIYIQFLNLFLIMGRIPILW